MTHIQLIEEIEGTIRGQLEDYYEITNGNRPFGKNVEYEGWQYTDLEESILAEENALEEKLQAIDAYWEGVDEEDMDKELSEQEEKEIRKILE